MRILVLVFLAAAGCATDDPLDTDEVELESSVWQWTDDVQIRNQSGVGQPGLAYFGNRMYMVHNGSSAPQELWLSRFNGTSWTRNVKLPQTASGGPALVVHNNQLEMIYRPHEQNRLVKATFNGTTFGTPVTIGWNLGSETLHSEPSAASFRGALYIAYCSPHIVYVDRLDGTTWSRVNRFSLGSGTCEYLELAALSGDDLRLIYDIKDVSIGVPHQMYQVRFDGTAWTGSQIPMRTTKPISMVTCNGTTHLVHGGVSPADEIWWAEGAGGFWNQEYRVPNQTSLGGAALGCFAGTRTIMVHNGSTNQLWQSEFGP